MTKPARIGKVFIVNDGVMLPLGQGVLKVHHEPKIKTPKEVENKEKRKETN